MKLEDYFKNGKAYVWKEKFAIIKAKKSDPKAFVNIMDKEEITVIINQILINKNEIIEIKKDWKIITLDIVFPMNVVGVTAKISSALARENITIMPIAAFSKDHFLVKDKDINKAIRVLENLGIKLIKKEKLKI